LVTHQYQCDSMLTSTSCLRASLTYKIPYSIPWISAKADLIKPYKAIDRLESKSALHVRVLESPLRIHLFEIPSCVIKSIFSQPEPMVVL
jgi:hypothetical protein